MDQGYQAVSAGEAPAGTPPARKPIPLYPTVELLGSAAAAVTEAELSAMESRLAAAQAVLQARCAQGDAALSWMHYPTTADRDVFARVNAAAQKIRTESDVLVVLSSTPYALSIRAGVEAMASWPEQVLFSAFCADSAALLNRTADRPFSVLRVALNDDDSDCGFAALYTQLKHRFGAHADRRVYVAAPEDSVLAAEGRKQSWTTLPLMRELDAADAMLTPAGLLPMVSAGANPVSVMMGSARMEVLLTQQEKTIRNPVWRFAAAEYLLSRKGLCPSTLRGGISRLEALSGWHRALLGAEEESPSGEVLLTVSGASAAADARTAIRLTLPSEDPMELAGLPYFFRLAETLRALL